MSDDLYSKGMRIRREVLGDAYVDKATQNVDLEDVADGRVLVAASEEDWRAGQRSRVLTRCIRRSDEGPAQPDEAAVAPSSSPKYRW